MNLYLKNFVKFYFINFQRYQALDSLTKKLDLGPVSKHRLSEKIEEQNIYKYNWLVSDQSKIHFKKPLLMCQFQAKTDYIISKLALNINLSKKNLSSPFGGNSNGFREFKLKIEKNVLQFVCRRKVSAQFYSIVLVLS